MAQIWYKTEIDRQSIIDKAHENTLVETLDIKITEIGDDFIKGTMPVDSRTKQPAGLLHGGASMALAETLASTGAYLCVDPEKYRVVGQPLCIFLDPHKDKPQCSQVFLPEPLKRRHEANQPAVLF